MATALAIFGVATILLITIRVSFITSVNETFQAQTNSGQIDQRTGLRGPRGTLRQCLRHP